jgi:hypothetical protein
MATRLTANMERSNHLPSGVCACGCHVGGPVVHPVPCCTPCGRCGLAIPNGLTHECLGLLHRATVVAHGRALVHWLTRLDLAFSAMVAVLVMAVAMFSLPLQGSLVLLAAALGGAALGVGLIVWRQARRRRAEIHRNEV